MCTECRQISVCNTCLNIFPTCVEFFKNVYMLLTENYLQFAGVTFKAHKLILAACSKHFQDLFETAPVCPSVLVILDGTSSSNMSALLEFMYKGEVHVSQESLSSFLKAAECLQVLFKISISNYMLLLLYCVEDVTNCAALDKLHTFFNVCSYSTNFPRCFVKHV